MFKRILFCASLVTLACVLLSCSRTKLQASHPSPPSREIDDDENHADNPFAAAEYFRESRMPGEQRLPIERYQRALSDAGTMRRYSPRAVASAGANPGAWESLGPANVGGRTRGMVIHPKNPNLMWAGGATGGIWKSTDGGQNWTAINDFAPVLVINCLVMDPVDPNVMYACTGEQTQNWRGAGIYKTSNGGATWAQIPSTANPDFYFVNNIAINPQAPAHLYAATNTGLWASLDGGTTWNLSLASPDGGPAATRTGGTTHGCYDALVQPGQATDNVFAVCHQRGSLQYSIFRNGNAAGGGSWSVVLSDPNMWYTVLAAAPSQPSTLYAISVTYETTGPFYRAMLAVYRSINGGAAGSWSVRTSNQDSNRLNAGILSIDSAYNFGSAYCSTAMANINLNGQAGYNLAVAVDPLDPNRVWASGVGLFRSDDGGANWGFAFTANHPDHHGVVFDPGYDGNGNQIVYSFSDGGVYKTFQGRGKTGTCTSLTSNVTWAPLNNGYVTTQFYHGVPYAGGAAFVGGTQDNGTLRGTAENSDWSSIYSGDGGVTRIDPLDPSVVYAEYVLGAIAKSSDGGFSFSGSTSGITEDSNNFPFIAWYVFDPTNPRRIYTGGRQIWRTDNAMSTWVAASTPTDLVDGAIDNIRAIAVSPFDANVVVFGTHSGKIFRSDRALTATGSTPWNFTSPRAGNVAHVEFDPNVRDTVYATYTTFNSAPGDNHVYRSTDGGATWVGLDGAGISGLPDVPVQTIAIDPADSKRLYLGTDTGIFLSVDGGATWLRDQNPLANVVVQNLAFDGAGASRMLYAFTYGRGVWRVPLPAGDAAPQTCSYSVSPSSITAAATGGVYAIDVTTAPGCAWSARPNVRTSVSQFVLQAPAGGLGSGKVYLTVAPNASTGTPSASVLVQGTVVPIAQLGGTVLSGGEDVASAQAASAAPFAAQISNTGRGQSTSDPVHSCTGSSDFQTAWARFTATQTGTLQVTVAGSGAGVTSPQVVLTAYPLQGQSAGGELTCSVQQLPLTASNYAKVKFPVTAGATYLLEFSTRTSGVNNTLYYGLTMTSPVYFRVSPPEAVVPAGKSQQFQPVAANLGNTGVRWSVTPQVGVITLDGNYIPPVQVSVSTPVKITAQSLADGSVTASSSVTVVPALPAVSLGAPAITNAASYQTGAVAPGEIVTIFGTGIGPADLLTAQLNPAGDLATEISGTQVLFDNIPAALIYVSANQVSAVVPYEVVGQASTRMTVVRNGQSTQPLTVGIASVAPGLFTKDASGSGQAAVVNQDTTLNGTGSGAPAGSVVSLYGTGEGQTVPGGINGGVAASVYPAPLAVVTAKIGGKDAEVQYAGAAPLATAGLLQVNVKVPALGPGVYEVVLTIGGKSSAAGVTLVVR